MSDPVIFTPNNEPYLGLESLMVFDHLIVASLNLNSEVAAYTHKNSLSRLQKAAAQIVPQGFNIALSVRELIRQGHLFAAAVLMRSLIERVGIISYLVKVPSAIDKWEDGWRHGDRPSLNKMLNTINDGKDIEGANQTVDTFNHLVHGDPMGSDFNLVHLDNDALGYGVGIVTNNKMLCDFLCDQAISWLTVLCGMTSSAFPEVAKSGNKSN
jgi:hypothetical protein